MSDQVIGYKAFSGIVISVVAGSLKIGYEIRKSWRVFKSQEIVWWKLWRIQKINLAEVSSYLEENSYGMNQGFAWFC